MTPDINTGSFRKGVKQFELTSQCLSREAVRHLAAEMLLSARSYEKGIVDGGDIEFLHQYRVSLRKTRALISLLKQVYPPDAHLNLKQRLSLLFSKTNELRDLDVYLQDWDDYVGLLPEQLHLGLMAMFVDFESKQRDAKHKLDDWLLSDRYQREIEGVLGFFNGPDRLAGTAVSQAPIYPLVTKKLNKSYRKVCQLGCAITDETDDEQIHRLRIECKKLRYLLDFFGDFYEKKAIKKLLKNLKQLQNRLGRFNDYSVQQAFLRRHLEQNKTEPEQMSSVQALLQLLDQRFMAVRKEIRPSFMTFGDDKTARIVSCLFEQS